MQAICILKENDLGTFENISSRLNSGISFDSEDIFIDDFNFEHNTIEDFIDYLEFQEIVQYHFITTDKSDRTLKFVDYLSSKTDIIFNVYNTNKDCLYKGHGSIPLEINNDLYSQIESLKDSHNPNTQLLIKNSLYCIFTGIYPSLYKDDLIKHLYLEDGNLFKYLNESIINKLSINGAIYIDKGILNHIPQHLICIDMDPYIEEKKLYIKMNENEFNKEFETFRSSGLIKNKYNANGIYDFSLISNSINMNRILIFESGIYLDFQKERLISENISLSIKEIQIQIHSTKQTKNVKQNVFHMLFSIAKQFPNKNAIFITPYSKFKLDFTKEDPFNFQILGICHEEKNYVYNIINQKLYEVNELFLEFLEADLKDLLDAEIFMGNYKVDKYKDTLKEYREIQIHAG